MNILLIIFMITFEQFGAIGNGINYDSVAIINALNEGKEIKARDGAIYYIDSSIYVIGKNINITGKATFLFKDNSNIKFSGDSNGYTTLKQNANVNDNSIEVDNTSIFNIGDIFSITTSEENSWGYDVNYRNGELHKIIDIVGNVLYTDDIIHTNWELGNHTLKVRQFNPITVNITGITFKYETPQMIAGGLIISYAKDNILYNVSMHDSQIIGIMFDHCYNNKFINSTIDGTNSYSGGYGLRFQSSAFSEVIDSKFYRNFKAIESSSCPPNVYDYGQFPNRNLTVNKSYGCGCGLASDGRTLFELGSRFVNTHATSQYVYINENIIENVYHALLSAGIDVEFKNNNISGKLYHTIAFIYGKNYIVENNTVDGSIGHNGGSFVLMKDLSNDGNVLIKNNNVKTCNTYAYVNSGELDVNNLKLIDNTITLLDNSYIFLNKSKNINIYEDGNIYIGNNITESKG